MGNLIIVAVIVIGSTIAAKFVPSVAGVPTLMIGLCLGFLAFGWKDR